MPMLDTPTGALYYAVTDCTAPWHPTAAETEAETIVFCHGVATNSDIWSAWLPALVERYRVVRFDTRGFGRSDAVPDGYQWSFDALGDDILAVASAAGADRFHLVGESAGGTACLALAAREGEGGRIQTLTLLSTGHIGNAIQNVEPWSERIAKHGMQAWSAQMMDHRFAPGAISQAQWDWFHGVQQQTRAVSLLGAADLLVASDLRPVLDNVQMPVLILSGGESPFVPLPLARDLAERLPNGQLRWFPGARHGVPFSHAVPASQALVGFLHRSHNY
jgi:pimeloyl-ACP methyl ester carboxylesterase